MPLLQPLHNLGQQGRPRLQPAFFGALAVGVGDILADPGPIPRAGQTLDDLAANRVAVTVEQFSGPHRGSAALEQFLEPTAFGERQRRTRPP